MIALDPSHALAWACVLGVGNGAIFPLMMTLPLDAADRPEQVAGLVGMMLGIGYTAGALAPVLIGCAARLDGLVRRRPVARRGGCGGVLVVCAACTPARLARGVRS